MKETTRPARHVPVLIVGGGPVGLALAAELGWRGVACVLIEQGDGIIATPKMNEVNTRTMEFCRRWGIADAGAQLSVSRRLSARRGVRHELRGYELGRMPRPPRAQPEARAAQSRPAADLLADWFDPILQRFARSFPTVTLRYRHRLESFDADRRRRDRRRCVDLDNRRARRRSRARLSGRLRRRQQRGARRARHRARRAGHARPSGAPVFPRAGFAGAVRQASRATFFLAIDRDGLWANIRVHRSGECDCGG